MNIADEQIKWVLENCDEVIKIIEACQKAQLDIMPKMAEWKTKGKEELLKETVKAIRKYL